MQGLPENIDSPISYVSEWLHSSSVWGGEGYGTPTTADMERDSSRFVYPPPSKLLTDSTPKQTGREEDASVIRSFLHEHDSQAQTQSEHRAREFITDDGDENIPRISTQEQAIMRTPTITFERCEPMVTHQEASAGSSPGKKDSETQHFPVRNLKISSPKSTHAARRASSPVVSKPLVPLFCHFNPKGTGEQTSYNLTVKDQGWRRYSDSNIPMEPEDLRIKPAIRSKSTGDNTSYELETVSRQAQQGDTNLLSVSACSGSGRDYHLQGPDDKGMINTKRLKLKTYLQNRYEADKEESPAEGERGNGSEVRMSVTSLPETETAMSVSGGYSQRSLSQSEVEGKGAPGDITSSQKRLYESPGKTHLTRAIQSWSLPHPITIKVEPVSPFPLSEDDPETPGSVFTPGINVPATPTSFLSPSVPRSSAPRQVFSFNVPPNREMSPPDQRHLLRRPLTGAEYSRLEKSASLGALTTDRPRAPPPPASPSHQASPRSHARPNQRHHSDTVIMTETHQPPEDVKPKEPSRSAPQPVDMRRSPPGGRRQIPPPLQLVANVSAFNQVEDQPMPSPGGPLLPSTPRQSHQHISEFLAASAPPAGLRSPAFPFATMSSQIMPHPGAGVPSHSESGSAVYPLLSPGAPLAWSAPPSAALLPQPSPRLPPASLPPGATNRRSGSAETEPPPPPPIPQLSPRPDQQPSAGAPAPPPPPPISSSGSRKQPSASKLTLTSMAAMQQLRDAQLRDGTILRDPNLHMCPVCGQWFPSYNYLANHMVNHLPSETVIKGPGENKLHLCKVCLQVANLQCLKISTFSTQVLATFAAQGVNDRRSPSFLLKHIGACVATRPVCRTVRSAKGTLGVLKSVCDGHHPHTYQLASFHFSGEGVSADEFRSFTSVWPEMKIASRVMVPPCESFLGMRIQRSMPRV